MDAFIILLRDTTVFELYPPPLPQRLSLSTILHMIAVCADPVQSNALRSLEIASPPRTSIGLEV